MPNGPAKPHRGGVARAAVADPAESLGVQIIAALGYTVVIVTLAAVLFSTFTDDFGLGQAEWSCPLVAAACLLGIRRHARR